MKIVIDFVIRLLAKMSGAGIKPPEINPVPESLPLLRKGSTGEHVKLAQSLLLSQGYFTGSVGGNFLDQTERAVTHFQQTHIGPDREPLEDDGEIGADTWWALFNPSGPAQRQNITPKKSAWISARAGSPNLLKAAEERMAVVAQARALHDVGVKEIPDGSNTGDGVTKYHKWYGTGPAPWCLYEATWTFHQATGRLPFGRKLGLVADFMAVAKAAGCFYAVGSDYVPRPGDFWIVVNPNGTGHIGIVDAVERDSPWAAVDVHEGNSGNRHALRRRTTRSENFKGYANPYGDAKDMPKFTFGLGLGKKAEAGTSQTR